MNSVIIIFSAILGFLHVCRAQSNCTEGEIRLTGTNSSNYYGRVELCYHNAWGTVCDDSWDINDANVVCRQLGLFPSGNHAVVLSAFGEGSGLIILDDVQCNGTESSLLECAHNGIGVHNCQHHEDAGVICTNNITCTNGAIRLTGIDSSLHEGRVELCYGNVWGTVCDDTWTSEEANVVCKQLGFTAIRNVASTSSAYGRRSGPAILNGVFCNGTESTLLGCPHSAIYIYNCAPQDEVAVLCTNRIIGGAQMIPPKVYSGCPSHSTILQEEILQILSSDCGVSLLGLSRQHPAQSCNQIHDANPSSTSGFYWIGTESSAEQIHCTFHS